MASEDTSWKGNKWTDWRDEIAKKYARKFVVLDNCEINGSNTHKMTLYVELADRVFIETSDNEKDATIDFINNAWLTLLWCMNDDNKKLEKQLSDPTLVAKAMFGERDVIDNDNSKQKTPNDPK